MHKHTLVLAALGVFCIVLVGLGFSLVGNPITQRLIELDNKRIEQFKLIRNNVQRFYTTNDKLPETLVQAAIEHEMTLDPQTKQPFDYKVVDNLSYQLCATFATSTRSEDDDSTLEAYDAYMSLSNDERLFWHQKGFYCIELKIPESIKPRITPAVTVTPTPTPIEIQNVSGSTSTTKKWQPYFYDAFGMTILIPDGWEVEIGKTDRTLPSDTVYISNKSNTKNMIYLYSVTQRSDLSIEDHVRSLSQQALEKKTREGEHALNYFLIRGKSAAQLVTLIPAELSDASSGIQSAHVLTLFELNERWFAMSTTYTYKVTDYSSNVIKWEEELERVNIYKKLLQSVQPITNN